MPKKIEDMTVPELRKRLRKFGYRTYPLLNKRELIDFNKDPVGYKSYWGKVDLHLQFLETTKGVEISDAFIKELIKFKFKNRSIKPIGFSTLAVRLALNNNKKTVTRADLKKAEKIYEELKLGGLLQIMQYEINGVKINISMGNLEETPTPTLTTRQRSLIASLSPEDIRKITRKIVGAKCKTLSMTTRKHTGGILIKPKKETFSSKERNCLNELGILYCEKYAIIDTRNDVGRVVEKHPEILMEVMSGNKYINSINELLKKIKKEKNPEKLELLEDEYSILRKKANDLFILFPDWLSGKYVPLKREGTEKPKLGVISKKLQDRINKLPLSKKEKDLLRKDLAFMDKKQRKKWMDDLEEELK